MFFSHLPRYKEEGDADATTTTVTATASAAAAAVAAVAAGEDGGEGVEAGEEEGEVEGNAAMFLRTSSTIGGCDVTSSADMPHRISNVELVTLPTADKVRRDMKYRMEG